jgi:hypothetical protein
MLLIVFPRLMECDIAPDASLVVMITFNMQHKHVKKSQKKVQMLARNPKTQNYFAEIIISLKFGSKAYAT